MGQEPEVNADIIVAAGNAELLEAATTRTEVLQGKGEPYGKITPKLHAGFLGGTLACLSPAKSISRTDDILGSKLMRLFGVALYIYRQ